MTEPSGPLILLRVFLSPRTSCTGAAAAGRARTRRLRGGASTAPTLTCTIMPRWWAKAFSMAGDLSRHSCDFQPLSAVISRLTYWSCNIVWFLCKTAIYLYINLLLLYFGSFHVHWSANQIIFHMFFLLFHFPNSVFATPHVPSVLGLLQAPLVWLQLARPSFSCVLHRPNPESLCPHLRRLVLQVCIVFHYMYAIWKLMGPFRLQTCID